jgi:hypothetical protein
MIGKRLQLDLSDAVRASLGAAYKQRIEAHVNARAVRTNKVYALALKNYEGKADPVTFPWPGASNAVISLTPSHTDAWDARIRNAGTANDPVYMTSAWGGDQIAPDMTNEEYAELFQEYSKWLEKEEVPNAQWMEQVSTIMTKFGNAIAYVPFEHDMIMDVTFGDDGKPVKQPLDLLNKPVIHVIHPKNFYMPFSEVDVQTSSWCGFDEYHSPQQVRVRVKTEEFTKAQAEAVLKFVGEKTEKELKKDGGPKSHGYFKTTEDGRHIPTEEYAREKAKSLAAGPDSDKIPFVRVFAREDTDGDGYPEEIEFLFHVASGIIVEAYWNRYEHKKRPLVMFSFKWREGTWLAYGVPEMLFNAQAIMDELVRDMLNNNKVRNTAIFAARSGGVIDPDEPVFPSRMIMMEDVERDFKVIPLGAGTPSTSLQDLALIQGWAERRDGMTDFNLGRERSSRTPATTMLALLEEGNERVVSIIHRLRLSQTEVWTQVHQLYAQNGDGEGLDRVLGKEKAARLRNAWSQMDVGDIRKKLVLNAQVSTQNLNRTVKRQEYTALLGQLDTVHQRALGIAQIVRGTTDPMLRAFALSMLKSTEFLMTRILNSYDIKDHSSMNPELSKVLAEMPPGPPMMGGPGGAPNEQVQQAQKQGPAAGPLNAPGRPEAGMPRMDGMGG